MSFSIVKKSLELFKDDNSSGKAAKKRKNQVATIYSTIDQAKHKKKDRRARKKKIEVAKKQIITAFDERHKFEEKDCTCTNVQFMRDISSLNVANESQVAKIVEYQTGNLAKNRPKEPVATKEKGSVFTDKDFDRFEKEYAF